MMGPAQALFAGQQPLHPGETINVNGTLEFVDWIFGDPADAYLDENLNLIAPGHVLTWKLHGNIEGTYVMTISFVFPPPWDFKSYGMVGQAVFTGEVLGKKTTWMAKLEGSGLEPNYPVFEGEETWDSTITSATRSLSHMRGTITISGILEPESYVYTYSGGLYFEIHKNQD